ncbi:MAG TPA: DUF3347 domain-containing protein [Ferruginibacter sp.]|nr:DUF3347 domain-containing protein [Ferruginibacter sp.]HMP20136.1 DUF3347 domain-containing protein [Ferruginibacter sp.]
MKKIIFLLLAVAIVFAGYWFFNKKQQQQVAKPERQQAITTNSHSTAFNQQIDLLLQHYFDMKAALVEADAEKVKQVAPLLIAAAQIDTAGLQQTSSEVAASVSVFLGDVQSNAASLLLQTDITEMRQDFRMISESLYPLLKSMHYEGATLYWQNCPMAFGSGKDASWLSNTAAIVNPYLGNNHPKYKAAMLDCGEVVDSIKAVQ